MHSRAEGRDADPSRFERCSSCPAAAASFAGRGPELRLVPHRSRSELQRVRHLESQCVPRSRRRAHDCSRSAARSGRVPRIESARRCGRGSIPRSSPTSPRRPASIYSRAHARPAGNNPCLWFQGGHNYSFPSGEAAVAAGLVTPYVLEYGPEYPLTYALLLVPLYVGAGRIKNQAHWQTDVIAGWAVGGLSGWYAHSRDVPIMIEILPHGFAIGLQGAILGAARLRRPWPPTAIARRRRWRPFRMSSGP